MSPRRVAVLIGGLPRESAYAGSLLGGDALWGLPEHLLALAVDHLAAANWQRSNAGRKESERTPYPKPVSRPGVRRERPKMTREVAERLLARGPKREQ